MHVPFECTVEGERGLKLGHSVVGDNDKVNIVETITGTGLESTYNMGDGGINVLRDVVEFVA